MILRGVILEKTDKQLKIKLSNNMEVYIDIPEYYWGNSWIYYSLKPHTKFLDIAKIKDSQEATFDTYWYYSDGDRVFVEFSDLNKYQIISFITLFSRPDNVQFDKVINTLKNKYAEYLQDTGYIQIINNLCILIKPKSNNQFSKMILVIPDNDNFDNPKIQLEINGNDNKVYLKTRGDIILEGNMIYLGGTEGIDSLVLFSLLKDAFDNHKHLCSGQCVPGTPSSQLPNIGTTKVKAK